MANPNLTLSIASATNITDPPVRSRISEWYSSETARCNSFWREAALVVPSVLLLVYLGFQARRHVKKLSHRKSYVMIAYYAILWVSALFNLAWSLLQVRGYSFLIQKIKVYFFKGWQCVPAMVVDWNLLSLFTESGLLSLEISIVGFLLQENYASGQEPLAHTFLVSGSFVTADILIQALFIFGFGVPLYINPTATDWGKWGVLFVHTLILTAIYCYILFVHYSKWRDKLPPRPSFYNYVIIMFIFNLMGLFAVGVAGLGSGFGIWWYNFLTICRHSLYLPYLYITFLSDFLREEDWLLDNAYYSEMKDAGFFDTDWE